jgi:hypothetical protein
VGGGEELGQVGFGAEARFHPEVIGGVVPVVGGGREDGR